MTTTQTTVAPTTIDTARVQAGDPAPTKPSMDECIAIAVFEGITAEAATLVYEYLRDTVLPHVRDTGTQFRPYNEYIAAVYPTIHAMWPHGQSAPLGSAASAFERSLLNSADGEFGITHQRAHDGALVHCELGICVNIVRI